MDGQGEREGKGICHYICAGGVGGVGGRGDSLFRIMNCLWSCYVMYRS